MRKKLYEIVEVSKDNDKASSSYDVFMLITIILSIIPLCFKQNNALFNLFDQITVLIFICDYFIRWITYDYKCKDSSIRSFLVYPVTPFAIIDLLAILPSLTMLNQGFKLFKLFRLTKSFKVFKVLRYSKCFIIIVNVLKRERKILLAVGYMAMVYIFISGLIMFQVEPNSFDSLFDAIYWSTTALTTVGYGDIYPITFAGKIVSMISSLMGIAIVALPAGIITGGYLEEVKNKI